MANFSDDPAVNAAAISFVSAIFSRIIRPTVPKWVWVSNWFASAFVSAVCHEFISSKFGAPSVGAFAIGFGFFGIAICETLENIRKNTDWKGIIKSRLGGQ